MNKITLNQSELEKVQKIEFDMLLELDRICRKHNIKYVLAYGTLIGALRHKGFIPWDDDIDVCMLRQDYIRFKEICKTELNEKYFYQSHDTDAEYYHLFDKIRANGTIFKETFLKNYNIHHGVYIDIFPVDILPESNLKRKIQYYKVLFLRIGLMSKYMVIDARSGIKKYMAMLLQILYKPFSLDFLYKNAFKVMTQYNNSNGTITRGFYQSYKNRKIVFPIEYYKRTKEICFGGGKFIVSKYSHKMLRTIYGNYMEFPPENERVTVHTLEEFDVDGYWEK